jgi:hypothetical protein
MESTSTRSVGVWVFVGVLLLGVSFAAVRQARRPWLRHAIGIHDVPVGSDVLGGSTLPGGSP